MKGEHTRSGYCTLNPLKHHDLVSRFGQDIRVSGLAYRYIALWMSGYPEVALEDVDKAIGDAREIGQAATLMFALQVTFVTLILCGKYAIAIRTSTNSLLWRMKETPVLEGRGDFGQRSGLAMTSKPQMQSTRLRPGLPPSGQREQRGSSPHICYS